MAVAHRKQRLKIPDDLRALPGGVFVGLPAYIDLMQKCWAEEPAERPNFGEIVRCLRDLLEACLHAEPMSPSVRRTAEGIRSAIRAASVPYLTRRDMQLSLPPLAPRSSSATLPECETASSGGDDGGSTDWSRQASEELPPEACSATISNCSSRSIADPPLWADARGPEGTHPPLIKRDPL